MTRAITLFYAWQDDTDRRFNRFLIRIALQMATTAINADAALDVKLKIDSDTEGEPGWAPVTETILRKIRECDIFLPDVSFVSRTATGKLIPNANVMFESGYAMHARTYKAMVPVMNTFYGPPEKLPFDMGHLRHPLGYWIDPSSRNAERRRMRAQLAKLLEDILRAQIVATAPPPPPPVPFPRAKEEDGPSRFRSKGEALGGRWDPMPFEASIQQDILLPDGPAMWLRLFSEVDSGRRWAAHDLKDYAIRNGGLNLSPFVDYGITYLRAEDGIGICSLQTPQDTETTSVAFMFEAGEVWSIDSTFLKYDPTRIPFIEPEFSKKLQTYADLLSTMGIAPPYRWIGGLTGVKGRRLTIPPAPGHISIVGFQNPTCLSDTISFEGIYDGTQTAARALLPLFKLVFDKCGIPRPNYISA